MCVISQFEKGGALDTGYELVRLQLDDTHSVLALSERGSDGRTFFDEMARDKKRRSEAIALRKALIRVLDRDIGWGFDSETIWLLRNMPHDVLVCEVRVKRKLYRIMCYLHDKFHGPLVLLFDFPAHEVKNPGGISKANIDKALRLSRIAQRLVSEELD